MGKLQVILHQIFISIVALGHNKLCAAFCCRRNLPCPDISQKGPAKD